MKKRFGKELDVYMSHSEAKEFVRKHGYDEFMKEVDKDFRYNFSSASVYWENDPSYICKLRGEGDVIIGWEEHHGKIFDD